MIHDNDKSISMDYIDIFIKCAYYYRCPYDCHCKNCIERIHTEFMKAELSRNTLNNILII